MKKALKVVGIAVGVLVLGFIALMIFVPSPEPELVEAQADNKGEEMETAFDQEAEVVDKVFNVGDTVEYNGLQMTITKAYFSEEAEYSKADNGKVLTLEVEATNNSNGKLMVDNTEFSLYDSEGNTLAQYYGYDEMAIADSMNSGKKLSGKLFFDVPEGTQYELIYTPVFSFNGDEDLVFNITVQ